MSRHRLTGTGGMLRLILRRDRIRLPVWVLGIVAVVHFSADAVQGLYATPEQLAAYSQTVGSSPAAIVMSGPPTAVDTIGGVVVFEVNLTAIVAVALMAIFLTVRHTRTEEETGRTELLRAGVLGQAAPVAATALVVSAASILVGAGIAVSFLALGLGTAGSLLYGASIAAVGVVFTFVAQVAAQVMERGRGALAVSVALLAGSFLLRGAGDVGNQALTWLAPIGLAQASHAFGENRWWPLGLVLVLAAVLTWATVVLGQHRDLGSGLVAPRPGPAAATRHLNGMVSFAARMQRGSVVGWTTGLLLLGLAFGSFGQEVSELVETNPDLRDILASGGQGLVDSFFATGLLLQALVATGFAVGSVLRLREAETSGQAELLLTTGQSRQRWAASWLLVTGVGSSTIVAAGGVGMGLAHSVATQDLSQLPAITGAALAYLPATLLLAALTLALFGWLPRAAMAAWAVLAGCFVVGWLGGLLQLPDRVVDLSPFTQVPQLPAAELDWTPITALVAVAVGLGAVAVTGLRRRDIG